MEWGEAIEVNGVRPEWLRDDEPATVKWITENSWSMLVGGDYTACDFMPFEGRVSHIKLPADHAYYTVQAHNAKYGTNFAYWPGGDNAPDDWDYGEVLFRNGAVFERDGGWLWDRYSTSEPGHIIGYTRKAPEKSVEDRVSVKRITATEADKLISDHGYDLIKVLDSLGIIRCTREERFTQETGIIVTPDVRAALEWKE